jgi:hypothetical protein
VPHHADAPVARLAARLEARLVPASALGDPIGRAAQLGGPQRLAHGHLHGVELVIARHLLHQPAAALVLEHDEVAQEVEEAPGLEHAFDDHLQLRQVRIGEALARDGAPGLEPFAPSAERPHARLHAVGGDQRRIGSEQRGDLGLVGLELVEGRPDRGVLVGRVLELDHRQREPVHEEHHVRPAGVLPLAHGELVDGKPVVVAGRLEVEYARLRPGDRAVGAAILHRDAVSQHAVHGAIALHQRRRFGPHELAVGVFQRLGRQIRVETDQRLTQAALQHHIAVVRVAALGL